jgi:hypothetical protein
MGENANARDRTRNLLERFTKKKPFRLKIPFVEEVFTTREQTRVVNCMFDEHAYYPWYVPTGFRSFRPEVGLAKQLCEMCLATCHARLEEVLSDFRTVYIDGTAKVNSLSLQGN